MWIGVDLCSNQRIQRALLRSPGLREEIFTDEEIAYCEAQPDPYRHYSGRWAAREACLKAFELGIYACDLRHIGVTHAASGAPRLQLADEARRILNPPGDLHLSISHERDYSLACVMVLP